MPRPSRRGFLKALLGAAAGVALAPLAKLGEVHQQLTWTIPQRVTPDKIAFIKALLDNAIESQDRMIEEALFSCSANSRQEPLSGLRRVVVGSDSPAYPHVWYGASVSVSGTEASSSPTTSDRCASNA